MKGRVRNPLSLASTVLRAVSPEQPTTVAEILPRICADFPAVQRNVVTTTLVMLEGRGDVVRVARGQYRRIVTP